MHKKKNQAKNKQQRKPSSSRNNQGWLTTDADEIERRRERGLSESFSLRAADATHPIFGTFQVASPRGGSYRVEVRHLTERINSCSCADFAVNGLGTCKHIEAVLHRQKKKPRDRNKQASARVEIFVDYRDTDRVRVLWPYPTTHVTDAQQLLGRFFTPDGVLRDDAAAGLSALQRCLASAPPSLRKGVRISEQINPWLTRLTQQHTRALRRDEFSARLARGEFQIERMIKVPLYPYQQEGLLHLAFTERALLADEMGLGKTVQAIAACVLLRQLSGVQRVLVVAPASLKAEWEEQIAKFSDSQSVIVVGSAAQRRKLYQQAALFYLTNYEQVVTDREFINSVLRPDVVVLDEAQRIKNWQTKTADAVKRLSSRYAFVLTGTPLENRIDEIFSIVQFLDPHIFGPLFRFNRDFYQLDEKGRPVGYRNLDELHRRLQPVMLRRRKAEVEGELPPRTINHYVVTMSAEQSDYYQQYETKVARLLEQAHRRPLLKAEFEQLQRWLACMRMLCDTAYILHKERRAAPKLEELKNLLPELLEPPEQKLIIFSEWERMLELVAQALTKRKIGYAWHTGSVPQLKRRTEINRFKTDSACRIFLSTDSGSVGLNLQNANVVINLDLPWNPAKLEQRIARAWRKHQTRPVQVINFICEDSIEQRMLQTLADKQTLADNVVDGAGKHKTLALRSGRAAMVERLQQLLGESVVAADKSSVAAVRVDPKTALLDDLKTSLGANLERCATFSGTSPETLFVVVHDASPLLVNELTQRAKAHFSRDHAPTIAVIDVEAYATIERLLDQKVLQWTNAGEMQTWYRSADSNTDVAQRRVIDQHLQQAQRDRKMADVLMGNDFSTEAIPAMGRALERVLQAFSAHEKAASDEPISLSLIEQHVRRGNLPNHTVALIAQLRLPEAEIADGHARVLYGKAQAIYQSILNILRPNAV